MKTALTLILSIFFALILANPVSQAFACDPFSAFVGISVVEVITLKAVKIPNGSLAMQIGALIASADQIFDRKSTPAYLMIEDIGAPIPLTKLLVEISGRPTISITSQNRIRAFAKLIMGGNGDTVLLNTIPIATGALKGQESTLTMTNGAATTPAVYASSPAAIGRPYVAGEQTIQDADRQTFRGFAYLIFDKTNLDYANVVFPDGWNEQMLGVELDQYFSIGRPYVEGDGTLSSQTIIDGSKFIEVTLFTSGGSITILRVD